MGIDDALKFQFCYLPDDNVPTGKKILFPTNVSPYYDILESYFKDKNNLIVKFAVIGRSNENFTKENPFPQFESTNTPEFYKYFENHIPFCSLYLKPSPSKKEFSTESEAVDFSRAGVTAFYNEIIAGYKKKSESLEELKIPITIIFLMKT
jgi:hypothetical protein